MKAEQQQGALTLFMVLVLLVLMSSWSFLVWRFNATEALVAASEARSVEAVQAADGGLEYALGWLGANPWCAGDSVPTVPVVDADSEASDNYAYRIVLSVSEPAGYPGAGLINVAATAHGPDGTNISAMTARSLLQSKRDISTFSKGSPPPLVIGGCLSGVTGVPELYPAFRGAALHTASDKSCIDFGNFIIHRAEGDSGADDAVKPAGFSDSSAWQYVFRLSKAEAKGYSDAQAAAGLDADSTQPRTFYWIDSGNADAFLSGGNWHRSVGSADHPVVLAFDEAVGCPKITGGTDIYGIVYYERASACDNQGWGGGTVYGSVVHEGNVTKFSSNSRIYHASRMSGASCLKWPVQTASWVPGTWQDFL